MSSYSLGLSNRLPLRDWVLSQTDLRPDLSWLSGSRFIDRLAECLRCVRHIVSFLRTICYTIRCLQRTKAVKSSDGVRLKAKVCNFRCTCDHKVESGSGMKLACTFPSTRRQLHAGRFDIARADSDQTGYDGQINPVFAAAAGVTLLRSGVECFSDALSTVTVTLSSELRLQLNRAVIHNKSRTGQ